MKQILQRFKDVFTIKIYLGSWFQNYPNQAGLYKDHIVALLFLKIIKEITSSVMAKRYTERKDIKESLCWVAKITDMQ